MRWTTVMIAATLALGAVPATAGDAGRAPGAQRAEWDSERERIATRVPELVTHRAGPAMDFAELVDAGDLDGDGKRDFVDFRWHVAEDEARGNRETLRMEAFRGTDGTALWSATVPEARYVYAFPTKVGAQGKPGVLVLSYEEAGDYTEAGGAWAYNTTVSAYDGAGKQLFVTPLGGGDTDTMAGYATGYGDVDDFLNGVTGAATDMVTRTATLVVVYDPVGLVTVERTATQFSLLDGATGTLRPFGTPVLGEWGTAWGYTVGDLDKDKLDDVVTEIESETGTTLTARRASDAGTLWTLARTVSSDAYEGYLPVADATGDGAADFAIVTEQWGGSVIVGPGGAPTMPAASRTMSLVDGARGKVLWRKSADRVIPIGNADRKAGAEIVLGSYLSSGLGFTVAAYTASGRRLWSVTRRVSAGKDPEYFRNSYGAIGDVGGDGVEDIGFGIVTSGKRPRRDEGTIDGRTGRVTRDPRPGMWASRAALDGRGADSYEAATGGGYLTLTAWSGSRRSRLWSVGVKASGGFGGTSVTSVDGDQCEDLVAEMWNFTSSGAVVYSGSTGRPLWVLTRAGNATGKVAKPAIRGHKVFSRGC